LELIYTSDLGRARETAGIIAAAQPKEVHVVATPDLQECDYGRWEGLTRDEIILRFPEDWENWRKSGRLGSSTGGEDFLSLAGRAGRAYEKAAGEEKTVLIAAHRGPLQAILCHAMGLDLVKMRRFFVTNCSLSALECCPGHWPRLILFNDAGHLEGVKVTPHLNISDKEGRRAGGVLW
jgi:broad specificity phosphatase PhoE